MELSGPEMHGTFHGGVQQQGFFVEKKIDGCDPAIPRSCASNTSVACQLEGYSVMVIVALRYLRFLDP